MIALVIILIMLVFIGAIIAGTVFWVLMLIDACRRKDWKDEVEMIIWLALMVAVGVIASIIYYFVIYQPRGKAVEETTPPPHPPAASHQD